ncbi:MAG: HalD/BesD family halogenase [Granulosicoccaceae bacterium]
MHELAGILDLGANPIDEQTFRQSCKAQLDRDGALVLRGFLKASAVDAIKREGESNADRAFYCEQNHNVYLCPSDDRFAPEHPRNHQVVSSKGCITDDQIPADSVLHSLYDSESLKSFFCHVLGEQALYEYADPLSSINLHYADAGKELGWHFDNSSFAITLLIQKPEGGGAFEYVRDLRDADAGELNFEGVSKVLAGEIPVVSASVEEGDLMLFRGRNSMHRVTPTEGETTRMLVVLAYNNQPGVALSESARMTFYGRLN